VAVFKIDYRRKRFKLEHVMALIENEKTNLMNKLATVRAADPLTQQWFYQMLGLGENTPFECIGQIQEVQPALNYANANMIHFK
jgi:hypothetical protein